MGPFIIHKGRFLAAGTHFFVQGGSGGAPEKNIFLRVLKFSGASKLPLNEKNIKQTSFRDFTNTEIDNMGWLNQLFVKGGAWICPPKILIPSKIYFFFGGTPLSPPARKKCVPAARNPSLWMIKGPIIYLPIFFRLRGF